MHIQNAFDLETELTDDDMLDISEDQALAVLAASDPFQTAPRATAADLAALS